jgi:hypothetical protein
MKEDVLEQIAGDYLQFKGYFTTHNMPFRPRSNHPDFVSRSDLVPSDIAPMLRDRVALFSEIAQAAAVVRIGAAIQAISEAHAIYVVMAR